MKQQLNEQIGRIIQIIESFEDNNITPSNNQDDSTEKDVVQNIHFVEMSGENSVVIGMDVITEVPNIDGSNKEVILNLEIEWVVYMTPFKSFPGVNNTNFYIKSIRKMEINPNVDLYLENIIKSEVKRGLKYGYTVRDLLTKFYHKYIGKNKDTSPMMSNMEKNIQTIAEMIKHKTIYLKSNIDPNDYLKPPPSAGNQKDSKINDLEREASKYETLGEFRKSNQNKYTQYLTAVRKGLIQNKFKKI